MGRRTRKGSSRSESDESWALSYAKCEFSLNYYSSALELRAFLAAELVELVNTTTGPTYQFSEGITDIEHARRILRAKHTLYDLGTR